MQRGGQGPELDKCRESQQDLTAKQISMLQDPMYCRIKFWGRPARRDLQYVVVFKLQYCLSATCAGADTKLPFRCMSDYMTNVEYIQSQLWDHMRLPGFLDDQRVSSLQAGWRLPEACQERVLMPY